MCLHFYKKKKALPSESPKLFAVLVFGLFFGFEVKNLFAVIKAALFANPVSQLRLVAL